jgi:ribosomal protein S18 acetylase RimI-like enzyme
MKKGSKRLTNRLKQGLIKRQGLTDVEVAEIEQLARVCNTYENLSMRVDWIKLRSPLSSVANDFLYYADGVLVGYLALDRHGTQEKELTGMVHPDQRHKGIFFALLGAARQDCVRRGIRRLLLVCEHGSFSGQALVAALGARPRFSEHEMVLETLREKLAFDERLFLRQAGMDDLDALVTIMREDSHEPVEELQAFVIQVLQEPGCQIFIASLGEGSVSCKESIGCLRLYELADQIGIYGFVVRPAYRGRGFGRQILTETIQGILVRSQKRIMLEVDTENGVALALYRSCGFKESRTYGYYSLDLV